jgi:hypothetical protein
VPGESVNCLKRASIKESVNPLHRGHFSSRVLFIHGFLSFSGSFGSTGSQNLRFPRGGVQIGARLGAHASS